jgi:hypothetical protein
MVIPALSGIALAIATLYGVAGKIGDFLDDHIAKMKQSDNKTVSRTGDVLDAAKYGFGIGYIAPVIIIAAGQMILGNSLLAAKTVLSAATLTNPIAMTCAALGAIIWGWAALTDEERADIFEKLTRGLAVGVELIKSVLGFAISKAKEVMNSKNVAEFKKYIKEYAAKFGKSLHEITHGVADFVKDAAEVTTSALGKAYDRTAEGASIAAEAASSALADVYETTSDAALSVRQATARASKRAYVKTVRAASRLTSSSKKSAASNGVDISPKTESTAAQPSSKTLKVAKVDAGAVRRVAKAAPKGIKRSTEKAAALVSKLASPPKKTTAPKGKTIASPAKGKPLRPVAA